MKKFVSIILILAMILCIGPVSFATDSTLSVNDTSAIAEKTAHELKHDNHDHYFETNQCVCGAYKADYSGYNEARDRYQQLVKNNDLNDAAMDYSREKHQEMIDEHLGGRWLRNNYCQEEQYILDSLEEDLNKLSDDLEAGIADGTFINPDYTEIEAKIAELEEKDVDNQYEDEIGAIKAELDTLKATNPKSMAEIADELATIEEQIDAISKQIDIDNCDHLCHSNNCFVKNIIWRIVQFFQRIFGINNVCEHCAVPMLTTESLVTDVPEEPPQTTGMPQPGMY